MIFKPQEKKPCLHCILCIILHRGINYPMSSILSHWKVLLSASLSTSILAGTLLESSFSFFCHSSGDNRLYLSEFVSVVTDIGIDLLRRKIMSPYDVFILLPSSSAMSMGLYTWTFQQFNSYTESESPLHLPKLPSANIHEHIVISI